MKKIQNLIDRIHAKGNENKEKDKQKLSQKI